MVSSATRPASHGLLQLVLFSVVLGALLFVLLLLQLPSDFDLEIGTPSPISLAAPYTISYTDNARTAAERDKAANDPANIFYFDDKELPAQQRQALSSTLDTITGILRNPSLTAADRRKQLVGLTAVPITETLALAMLDLSSSEWVALSSRTLSLYDQMLREHASVIDVETLEAIKLQLPSAPALQTLSRGREIAVYLIGAFMRVNRQIDQVETERRQRDARDAVPEVKSTLVRGESIIRRGDLVTAEHLEKFSALGLSTPELSARQVGGRILIAVLFAAALTAYLYFYERELWARPRPLLVLGLLVILGAVMSKLLVPTSIGRWDALPLALFGILVAGLFRAQLAVMVALLLALIAGFLKDNSFSMTAVAFSSSLAGIYAIRRPDRTTAFLKAGLWVGLITAVMIFALRITDLSTTFYTEAEYVEMFLFSCLNGLVSGLGSLGAYNFLGKLAGIVTSLQLLELAHPNQPLLRRLMQEAPGTHHHSIVVSNLCESAAEAIGADSLLLRVGAYYHDVGKIVRPYFFTDNQHNRSNVHENLDPRTSAGLICDHVLEGVKLARAHGLPQQIVDFIPQHHGTTVIKYFYQQALQRDDTVSIDDYRYPGPKPQSKEAAILMLADTCEATVRSREQAGQLRPIRPEGEDAPEPGRGQTIEEVVDHSIQERIRSGELSECSLTLRDLDLIKQAFVKTLQGIYHPRVDYPNLVKPK